LQGLGYKVRVDLAGQSGGVNQQNDQSHFVMMEFQKPLEVGRTKFMTNLIGMWPLIGCIYPITEY